ncbi:hypothetical protein EBR57_07210, partial [bacterium]|nr:hypothetical protein [bacterium]
MFVDLRKILASNSTELPVGQDRAILGTKASAYFLVDGEGQGDSTGNVGIFIKDYGSDYSNAIPLALLHVSDKYMGTSASPRDSSKAVRFDVGGLAAISNVMIVGTSNERVAIGMTVPTAALHVRGLSTTSNVLLAQTSAGLDILSVSSRNMVGAGTATPSATLHIAGDATLPSFLIASVNSALLVDAQGNVGLRATDSAYALNVSFNASAYPTAPAFLAQLSNTSPLIVSRDGYVGVYVVTNNAGVAARIPLRAGTGTVTVPSDLNPTSFGAVAGRSAEGILAVTENRYIFFGVTSNGATSVESVLSWYGAPTASTSLFSNGLVDLRLAKDRVSMGTVTSDATLTISGSSNPILKVVAGTSPFVINSNAVGVGTSNPTVPFVVSGNVRISSQNGGLVFGNGGILDVNSVSMNQLIATDTIKTAVRPVLSVKHTAAGGSDTVKSYLQRNYTTIDADFSSSNVVGMALTVTSSAGAAPVSTTRRVIGVNVDVTNINTADPITPGGTRGGLVYPALFMGGQVVVGGPDTSTSAALIVQGMNYTGATASVTSSDVMKFAATYSGTSTSKNYVTLAVKSGLTPTRGTGRFHPYTFTVIPGVTSVKSVEITQALWGQGALQFHGPLLGVGQSNPNYGIGTTLETVLRDLSDVQKAGVSSIIDQFFGSRRPFEFRVDYASPTTPTKTYGITLLNGFRNVSANPVYSPLPGTVMIGSYNAALVTANLTDAALYVSGDVRVGVVTSSVFTGTEGWGSRLYFSGGSTFVNNVDSDNKDPIYIGRYNIYGNAGSGGWSELRVAVGEDNT